MLNHTRAALLRVIRKDRHRISSGICCRLRVILKVVMWSKGSFMPSYDSSCRRQNLGDRGNSKTFVVKGESVLFTIPSKFLFVFSFIAFFSSSISFLMILRRSLLTPSNGSVLLDLSLLWLFSSSSALLASTVAHKKFPSCCNCYLISWFFLVSSSKLAMRVKLVKPMPLDLMVC